MPTLFSSTVDDDEFFDDDDSDDEYDSWSEWYHHSPELTPLKGKEEARRGVLFGWELEVECKRERNRARVMKDAAQPFFEYHEDGSLNYGFELASAPATWPWYKENVGKLCELLGQLRGACRAARTDTCGIHIHIDRKAFVGDHLYRFIHFVYSNPKFIELLAQRAGGSLAQWASLDINGEVTWRTPARTPTLKDMRAKARGTISRFKYQAVNTSRQNTIEVRIFRATLCPEAFMKNLEFVHALFSYTKKANRTQRTQACFTDFVAKNAEEYPNLHQFLSNPLKFKLTDKPLAEAD